MLANVLRSCVLAALLGLGWGRIVNIEDHGVVPDDPSLMACFKNAANLNRTLQNLAPGDVLLVPAGRTYWTNGGIQATGLRNVVLQIDGTIKFSDDQLRWPRDASGRVKECLYFENIENVTFTSSGRGVIDGNGQGWWGALQYLLIAENRPRLINIYDSKDLLMENLLLKDSPFWTFWAHDIANLEIRNTNIDARRDPNATYHDFNEIQAFNTDGFDVAGKNVWIHDCTIWNNDDCIAVKDQRGDGRRASCSENMLFERINASGVGFTIGSIGVSKAHTCVRNITFRDSVMPNTFKGIYLKARPGRDPAETGEIRDILYENIEINNCTQWPIWIGPQQASYQESCSLLWPLPGTQCPVPIEMMWRNITLRNITINNPVTSPGVILGNTQNPMVGITFDGVKVNNPGQLPWGKDYYACEGVVNGIATGGTWPVPSCFKQVPTLASA